MLRSIALAGAVSALVSMPVIASTIPGNITATIAAPEGCAQTETFVCDGGGTDSLKWGSGNWKKHTVDGTNPSVLTVSGGPFSIASPGRVTLGTITWLNMATWYTGGVWDSTITFELGTPSSSVNIDFTIDNTADATNKPRVNNKSGQHPDAITLTASPLASPLDLGNGLLLSGLSFGLIDAGTPGQDASAWFWNYGKGKWERRTYEGLEWGSKFDPETGLWENREGGTSILQVYGNVEPAPDMSAVPLPAGVWLLLSGLGGAFMIGRRRRAA
ncbi:MAG: choice-of-anchor K domain-containing protein [Pseudomonadota bacterium]